MTKMATINIQFIWIVINHSIYLTFAIVFLPLIASNSCTTSGKLKLYRNFTDLYQTLPNFT